MAVTYDKIGFTLIEKGLRDHINDDFQNVYISNKFKMIVNECVRINLEGSSNLMTTNAFEQREYNVIIRYYFNNEIVNDNVNKSIKDKSDRLRKKLLDKQTNTTSWVALDIDEILYGIEDDENEESDVYIVQYELTLVNHNPIS